jgi:hypothetical protein
MGFILVLFFAGFIFSSTSKLTQNKVIKNRVSLNVNDTIWLERNIAFYRILSKSEKIIFQDRLGLFLSEIIITETNQEIPEKSTCLYVASAAIIAYWGLPYWNYGELSEVIVYPDNFDKNSKIDKSGRILGKVHHGGLLDSTMILSRTALIHGFKNTTDGRNVGIHEFTHLIDKSDGNIDGLPVGLIQEERKNWLGIYKNEAKKKSFQLNSYAKTNEAEFFAVTMELFKENPTKLKKWHPELYTIIESHFNGPANLTDPV